MLCVLGNRSASKRTASLRYFRHSADSPSLMGARFILYSLIKLFLAAEYSRNPNQKMAISTAMKTARRIAVSLVAIPCLVVVVLHYLFSTALNGPPPTLAALSEPHEYYFAYGSNMNPQYLGTIRGVESQWRAMGKVVDYEVQFSLAGIPMLEPSFANLAPMPGKVAVGVVYRLAPTDIEALMSSEGNSYEWRPVLVSVEGRQPLTALTLVAPPSMSEGATPSRRYLTIMYRAATYFEFPEKELERLDPKQGSHVPILSEATGVAIQSMTWISARL